MNMSCNAVCKNIYETIGEGVVYLGYPMGTARDLRADSLKEGGTWMQSLGARALFVAQSIVSIVAIPLIILAALFMLPLAWCADVGDTPCDVLKFLGKMSLVHLSAIPTSLIAALVPHSCEWSSPAKEVAECL